jgi:hypothetical protein
MNSKVIGTGSLTARYGNKFNGTDTNIWNTRNVNLWIMKLFILMFYKILVWWVFNHNVQLAVHPQFLDVTKFVSNSGTYFSSEKNLVLNVLRVCLFPLH